MHDASSRTTLAARARRANEMVALLSDGERLRVESIAFVVRGQLIRECHTLEELTLRYEAKRFDHDAGGDAALAAVMASGVCPGMERFEETDFVELILDLAYGRRYEEVCT